MRFRLQISIMIIKNPVFISGAYLPGTPPFRNFRFHLTVTSSLQTRDPRR